MTPYQAVSVAIGSTVGVGNIGGVATAVAVGGPGAVFWMWMAGIFGQAIKMVEVSLALYYRTHIGEDLTYGGPTYYISRGIGKEKGWNTFARILCFLFLVGFFIGYIFNIQNYTVSEAIAGTFNVNILLVSFVFLLLLYANIWGGIKGLGKIASLIVPFMCLFYIGGGLIVIFRNVAMIPETIKLIFSSAFTGTAAIGGFTGAAFSKMIQVGMARAVYSNEAGWGSSPMIHATAKVNHPVKQGIMGIFEVFTDTLIICTITAFMIINSGTWSSGLDGATLTLSAFSTGFGQLGAALLVVGIFLFGLTTATGLFAQFETLFTYIVGPKTSHLKTILKANKIIYPLPGFLLVLYAYIYGLPTYKVWMFIECVHGNFNFS
ncbi:amino acid carrier protein [Acetomicrobium sp.]|uniref:alanine/glycine:cation symporter family protein n=1 Tax=Acetomicrobium sp. TaxID=1872099 RepID=UPI0028718455|nr:amino acid carrier protein [Acetomicrobium sp.]MDR9768971.1 amino acid carrier protein [Acetomicrobium sp.]